MEKNFGQLSIKKEKQIQKNNQKLKILFFNIFYCCLGFLIGIISAFYIRLAKKEINIVDNKKTAISTLYSTFNQNKTEKTITDINYLIDLLDKNQQVITFIENLKKTEKNINIINNDIINYITNSLKVNIDIDLDIESLIYSYIICHFPDLINKYVKLSYVIPKAIPDFVTDEKIINLKFETFKKFFI